MDSFLGDGEVHQIDLIQMNRLHQGTSFLRSVHAEGREDPGSKEARDSMHSEKRACNMKLPWEQ